MDPLKVERLGKCRRGRCVVQVAFGGETESDEPWDGFNSDAEADADALASAGWGTDEDYGCFDDYNDGF